MPSQNNIPRVSANYLLIMIDFGICPRSVRCAFCEKEHFIPDLAHPPARAIQDPLNSIFYVTQSVPTLNDWDYLYNPYIRNATQCTNVCRSGPFLTPNDSVGPIIRMLNHRSPLSVFFFFDGVVPWLKGETEFLELPLQNCYANGLDVASDLVQKGPRTLRIQLVKKPNDPVRAMLPCPTWTIFRSSFTREAFDRNGGADSSGPPKGFAETTEIVASYLSEIEASKAMDENIQDIIRDENGTHVLELPGSGSKFVGVVVKTRAYVQSFYIREDLRIVVKKNVCASSSLPNMYMYLGGPF